MTKAKILVAEDDRAARVSLKNLLEAEGFQVVAVDNGQEALSYVLSEEPEVALLDVRMPGLDGPTLLKKAREGGSLTALIVMTAHGDSNTAIEAMKTGAFDYVTKPLDFHLLLPQIERAIEHHKLIRELAAARTQASARAIAPSLIGHSPLMQHVYKLIGQVAGSDATVLVRGESGTARS